MRTRKWLLRPLWLFALATVALTAVAAACGGGGGGYASPRGTPAATPKATPPAATPRTTPAATPGAAAPAAGTCNKDSGLCSADAQAKLTIEEGDAFFVASKFTFKEGVVIPAKVGQSITVTVKNVGTSTHNMRIAGLDNKYETGNDDVVSNPDTLRGSQSGTLSFKFDQAGEFKFRCDFHPQEMTGTIKVAQ